MNYSESDQSPKIVVNHLAPLAAVLGTITKQIQALANPYMTVRTNPIPCGTPVADEESARTIEKLNAQIDSLNAGIKERSQLMKAQDDKLAQRDERIAQLTQAIEKHSGDDYGSLNLT